MLRSVVVVVVVDVNLNLEISVSTHPLSPSFVRVALDLEMK